MFTNKSQTVHGLTQKACFPPIKQTDTCSRVGSWFPPHGDSGTHPFPSFGSTAPEDLVHRCEGREWRKNIYFFTALAWKWHAVPAGPSASADGSGGLSRAKDGLEREPRGTARPGGASAAERRSLTFDRRLSLSPPSHFQK